MLQLLTTVILLLLSLLVHSDPIYVKMDMTCDGIDQKYWCADLYIYEEDYDDTHDILTFERLCTSEKRKVFKWEFNPDGDVSPEYEIAYQVSHSCTPTGQYWCIRPEAVDVSVRGPQQVDFNVDLFNAENVTESACLPMY
ncbi:Protein CBG07129 [Caenorhabditis briggsae]|uniref:Protein CBG07129 n=1 Tax=Caenorhabditis briggsae TaxID=6238 RepID=A8X3M9_CAEBR|nr:Protein CBG07129 [Caenorhabditis briggsae]CAP27239.1 Protein CBG07129 [Caenorhabditis briggsae]